MLSEYLLGCKNKPVKILHWNFIIKKINDLIVLQKSENPKYHPIDYSTGVIIVVDNNYNFHRYLDHESVSFIIFAFWDVFPSI